MKETKYMFPLFKFQCLPHYFNEVDTEVLPWSVNVLVFFKCFIIVNYFACWYYRILGDALCNFVPFEQFKKTGKTPMEECYF